MLTEIWIKPLRRSREKSILFLNLYILHRLALTGNVWSVTSLTKIPLDDFYGTPN